MLLPLENVKRAKISDVKAGNLVLYWHTERWFRALKVQGTGAEAQALIVMPLEYEPKKFAPWLFAGMGDEWCLEIGKPQVWMTGDFTTVLSPGKEARFGYLAICTDGIALGVAQKSGDRFASVS